MNLLLRNILDGLAPGAKYHFEGGKEYDNVVWQDPVIPKPTLEQCIEYDNQITIRVLTEKLKTERNRLLAETDWWMLADQNPTPEQKAYRQALRDLPNTSPPPSIDENGNIVGWNFPTKPQI